MEKIRVSDLSFKYPLSENLAIKNINLSIEESEFVVLCGKSGCGKSTLLRHLKKQMIPYGQKTGHVYVDSEDIETMEERKSVSKIGFIQQNPESQIVTDKVWHELAFGLENLGLDNSIIKRRVAEMANYFGIQTWFRKDVNELSGGQKQLLNLASVMVMQPEILILDEPTSQLDPIATSEFLNTLQKVNRELGTTILISEHRLEEIIPMADKIALMENGEIVAFDRPEKIDKDNHMFEGFPTIMRIFQGLHGVEKTPLTIRDGRILLKKLLDNKKEKEEIKDVSVAWDRQKTNSTYAIEMKDVWFKYNRNDDFVLKGVDMSVPIGSWYCLLGGNGTGKSTLLKALCDVIKIQRGKIKKATGLKLSMVPQNPQSLFTEITVEEELLEGINHMGFDVEIMAEKVENMLDVMEIGHLRKANPYDLSGGEQQRLAIGKVLLTEPDILLLDEPTKGLDPFFKKTLAKIFKNLLDEGLTIFMVSHDIEFCAEHGQIASMFFDGEVLSKDNAKEFFAGNSFYTTSANKLFRNLNPNIVTCKEAQEWIRKII